MMKAPISAEDRNDRMVVLRFTAAGMVAVDPGDGKPGRWQAASTPAFRHAIPAPMRPPLHPWLPNGRTGDATLYLAATPGSGAMLFDCGDLSALPPRHLLRVETLLVSHTHMDHWADFDRLLRLLIGRPARLQLVGPAGFGGHVFHRLNAYAWNLADRIGADLVFEVVEVTSTGPWPRTRFRLHGGFAAEPLPPCPAASDGTVLRQGGLRIRAAALDHGTPCLGFAVEQDHQLNILAEALAARGLPAGPWLVGLKHAVASGAADALPIPLPDGNAVPLGTLRDLVAVTPGQRIAYVTDIADTPANRAGAIGLARGADILFIEAPFAAAHAALALDRQHLTTTAAGEIARAAGVRRVEPFHFSPRYQGQAARLLAEVAAAAGPDIAAPTG